MKTILATVTALFSLLWFGAHAASAEYPDPGKTISIICITAAGGSSDTQIRTLSIGLSKYLKDTKVQVANIPGASGKIAYEKAFKAAPDGYTLLNYNLPAPIVTEMAEEGVRYKTSEFTPIYALSTVSNVLVVNSDAWSSIDEFIEEGRKRTVTIGTTGNKTANYLQAVAFVEATKIKANLVPFGGGAESVKTLAGKHIDAVCTLALTPLALIRAGKIKPLMVFADEPDPAYPGVPISKGSKWDIDIFPLIGAYVGPPGLPAAEVKILEDAFEKAVKEPTFVEWAKNVGLTLTPMNAEKLKSMTTKFYSDVEKFKSYFATSK